nr:uncharacterized protein LOC119162321 [Rhipicephalus microplus]
MEASAENLRASPRSLLWAAIERVSERARPPSSEVPGFSEEETKNNQCCAEHLLDFHELQPATSPGRCSPILGAPTMTSASAIIADMVAAAQLKQCPLHLMFTTRCGRFFRNGENFECVVGSDGRLSARVNASPRYIYMRLQGMKSNHRYFVSINVELCGGDTSDRDNDVAGYVVPEPNLLDGLGWTNSTLFLDVTVLLEKYPLVPVCTTAEDCGNARYKIFVRILQLSDDFWPAGVEPILITLREGPLVDILSARQQRMNQPGVFPFGMQDVTRLSDNPMVSGMSLIPYRFSSLDSPSCYPRPEEVCMPVTRVLEEVTPQFCTREESQSELSENLVSTGFLSAATFSSDHVIVERGRTNFFRDLDGEAFLRQLHLRQRRPPVTPPGESHRQQCSSSLWDDGHLAMPDETTFE